MTPPVAPRPAATVMLLRDRDGLEVLLLRRSTGTPFVPGAHVFPGGAVDPGDDADHADIVLDLPTEVADRVLGIPGATAFWIAAVRECLEEAGVLLAVDATGHPVGRDHPALFDLPATRKAIEAGQRSLVAHCRDHGLRLPLADIAYVSRWITPAGSPRRYDARFFAARMPAEQDHLADGWEAVDSAWWHPARALADWQAGAIDLIQPTVASLELLDTFATASEAMAAFHDGARHGLRISQPGGGERIASPGERAALDRGARS